MPVDGDEKIPSRNSDNLARNVGQRLESEDGRQRSAYVVPESNDLDACEEYVDGDALWFGSNDDDGGDSTLGENTAGDMHDERSVPAPTLFEKELYGSWLSCCCPLGFRRRPCGSFLLCMQRRGPAHARGMDHDGQCKTQHASIQGYEKGLSFCGERSYGQK